MKLQLPQIYKTTGELPACDYQVPGTRVPGTSAIAAKMESSSMVPGRSLTFPHNSRFSQCAHFGFSRDNSLMFHTCNLLLPLSPLNKASSKLAELHYRMYNYDYEYRKNDNSRFVIVALLFCELGTCSEATESFARAWVNSKLERYFLEAACVVPL